MNLVSNDIKQGHGAQGGEAVDLVGVDEAVHGVVDDAVRVNGRAQLIGQLLRLLRQCGLADLLEHGYDVCELGGHHGVGGDKVGEGGGVVARPEGAL